MSASSDRADRIMDMSSCPHRQHMSSCPHREHMSMSSSWGHVHVIIIAQLYVLMSASSDRAGRIMSSCPSHEDMMSSSSDRADRMTRTSSLHSSMGHDHCPISNRKCNHSNRKCNNSNRKCNNLFVTRKTIFLIDARRSHVGQKGKKIYCMMRTSALHSSIGHHHCT